VEGVLEWLASNGFNDTEEITTAEEHLIFATPPELRKAQKAAKN
jgi:4-hydroxy-3-methylbut-2-enyl diphosphate reductase